MSHEKVQKRRYVAFTCIMLAALTLSTLLFFVLQPLRTTHAANPSYNWKQLKIGGGGFVTGIVIHPTVPGLMYVRTDVGGAYKLGPNDTWQQLVTASAVPNPTQGDYNVVSLAVSKSNPQTLYLAAGNDLSTQNGRILKSSNQGQTFTDNGQRWSMDGNADYRQGSERLAVDPNNDNVAYFGSPKEGLWVTTDGGQNWTQVPTSSIPVGTNSGNTPAGDEFVLFDPTSSVTNGKTSRIYVGVAGSGVYKSEDAGASWNNVISTDQIPYTANVASDSTLYVSIQATTGAGAVERYSPTSNTATTISPSPGGNSYVIAVDPHNPQRVIAGAGGISNGNIWRTTDGGSTWTALNISVSSQAIPWITQTDEVNFMSSAELAFDPLVPDKLWFPQGTGVWYSSDNSGPTINWNFYSQGIEETVSTDLIAPPGGATISTIYDRQGFYHENVDAYPAKPLLDSAFWGGTSLDYSGGNPSTVVTVQAKNNYYPALTARGAISADGGKNWKLFGSIPPGAVGGNIAISSTDPNNLVWLPSTGNFGQGTAPYYSQDGGQTWTQSTGLSDPKDTHWLFWWGSKRALASDKVNNAFYAITFSTGTSSTGTFSTSTDGGKTFVTAANSPACAQSGDCHVFGQIHAAPGHAGHVWSSAAKDGLWYTTDAGQSAWTKVSAVQEARAFGFGKTLPGTSYPAIYLYGKANGDTSFGIYRSSDQGATWSLLSTAPLGIYDNANVVNGDMNIAGRVYVGFSGNGFAYGDDPEANNSANKYEAEQAKLSGRAAVNTNHANYSGSGFVDGYWHQGAATTFTVTVAKAGKYKADLRYANGTNRTRTLNLYVNGKRSKTINLAKLGNWDTWGDRVETLVLKAGSNTITYKYDRNDSGNVNLDYLQLSAA
ncbi:carbohydrate-binding protein [Dictyobacter alpinus]|uniref:Carbohydrate-binding protein n=1 Tax=Dictyobacter alpinus TaxID=2014873 RepID=A0A402BK08_9CHLR|nr:CBM35 domain-containing protein [Dictyobacter alpinus]GCE31673.1 carbohydrate-binding protein [Dictyobacter alpinus]